MYLACTGNGILCPLEVHTSQLPLYPQFLHCRFICFCLIWGSIFFNAKLLVRVMFLCFSNGSIHSLKHRSVLPSIWISFDQSWAFYIFQFKHSRWYPIAFITLFSTLRVWSCVYLCVIHTENIYFIFSIWFFFFRI